MFRANEAIAIARASLSPPHFVLQTNSTMANTIAESNTVRTTVSTRGPKGLGVLSISCIAASRECARRAIWICSTKDSALCYPQEKGGSILQGFSLLFRAWEATDPVVAFLSVAFFLIGLVGLYFLARRWFNYPVAVTALLVTAMHFLLLRQAISGLQLTFLMCLVLLLFHLLKLELEAPTPLSPTAFYRCIATSILVSVAALTRFEMLAYVPVVAFFWYLRMRPQRLHWRFMAYFLGVFFLLLSPWVVRCTIITKHPMLTLRGYEIIMATGEWPGQSVYRSFSSVPPFPTGAALFNPRTMIGKLHRAIRFTYSTLPGIANPYLLALFISGFLFPGRLWKDAPIRWWILLTLIAQIVFMCVYVPFGEMIGPLLPLLILFAVVSVDKAVCIALEETEVLLFWKGVIQGLALSCVALIVAYPLADLLFIQPAATKSSLPKVAAQITKHAHILMSDIPQALAWYGDRPAMLFAHHPNDLEKLREAGLGPDTIYLSPLLLRYPREELVKFWQTLVAAPRSFQGYEVDQRWRGPGVIWRYVGRRTSKPSGSKSEAVESLSLSHTQPSPSTKTEQVLEAPEPLLGNISKTAPSPPMATKTINSDDASEEGGASPQAKSQSEEEE